MPSDIQIGGFFCDDIRQEIGGKYSLIGVYGDALYVTQFPFSLGAIKVAISIRGLVDSLPDSIEMSVKANDKEIVRLAGKIGKSLPENERGIDTFLVPIQLPLPNHELKGDSVVNVEVFIDDKVYQGPDLAIRQRSES